MQVKAANKGEGVWLVPPLLHWKKYLGTSSAGGSEMVSHHQYLLKHKTNRWCLSALMLLWLATIVCVLKMLYSLWDVCFISMWCMWGLPDSSTVLWEGLRPVQSCRYCTCMHLVIWEYTCKSSLDMLQSELELGTKSVTLHYHNRSHMHAGLFSLSMPRWLENKICHASWQAILCTCWFRSWSLLHCFTL